MVSSTTERTEVRIHAHACGTLARDGAAAKNSGVRNRGKLCAINVESDEGKEVVLARHRENSLDPVRSYVG